MERLSVPFILEYLQKLHPNAHCELTHRNPYELSVAVILSAQTTDVSVNRVTPALFKSTNQGCREVYCISWFIS